MAMLALLLLLGCGFANASNRPWMNLADPPQERALKLVAEMTTKEKLSLFHGSCSGYTGNVCGIPRLGIPQQKNNDGPQGFRGAPGTSTSWPSALTVAASFDTELMQSYGEAMGDEFYRKGANIQLGPGVCVARVPRNGRNFEYVSGEDPFLGYQMAGAIVTGIQSQGVIANAKHFVDNSQESARTSITENIDERTQFEMYYPPFEGAVHAGVGSFMCSYNKVCLDCPDTQIGNWSCENYDSLQRDLKDRIGFKGWVMSDWGATHSTSMNRGLDQQMPDAKYMGDALAAMVKSGEVSMAKVNDSAVRILWPFFAVGAFDKENNNTKDNNVTSPEHKQLARKFAAEATVLLKNAGALPIKKSVRNIAIIGQEAASPTVHGGGSGQVFPDFVATPLDSMRSRFGIPPLPPRSTNCSDGTYEKGIDYHNTHFQTHAQAKSVGSCCELCAASSSCNAFSFSEGTCFMKADASGRESNPSVTSGVCRKGPAPPDSTSCHGGVCVRYSDGHNTTEAALLAASADVAIVFVGTTSSEGGDRADLGLGAQDALIGAVAKVAGPKTVVVAVTPGALLTPWREQVSAILTPFMPGQEYGNAISDVLFGDVNPSGKLPITFPAKENEMEFTDKQWPGENGISLYSEKLLVGYRWYDAHRVSPAYPFGHGLSYTDFEYSELALNGRTVSCKVTNAGAMDGSDAVQLYLEFPTSAGEPPKQLKGIQKIRVSAGQSAVAKFELNDRSFSIWDINTHKWSVVAGQFGVFLGSSSQDIRLKGTIQSTRDVEVVI